MSNIFFTSDSHFGHANIIVYSKRPFGNPDEMDEKLIENWNNTVKKQDTVYHMGDFCFGDKRRTENIVRRLNGHVHWCFGNHDKHKGSNAPTKAGGFAWKGDYKEIRVGKQNVKMSHYAHLVWNKSHHGAWFLCGHSHGDLKFTLPENVELAKLGLPVMQLDVGMDVAYRYLGSYRPFAYEEVEQIMKNKASMAGYAYGEHHKKRGRPDKK